MPKYQVAVDVTYRNYVIVDADDEESAINIADDYLSVSKRVHMEPALEFGHDAISANPGDGRWESQNWEIGEADHVDD